MFELRDVNGMVSEVLLPWRVVPLLTRLGTDNVMSCQCSALSYESMHCPDAQVATASWTKLRSRSPLAAMPKLYLELRPSLTHSCTTMLFEKPVLLILVMNCCKTDSTIPWTPEPAKRPTVTELEYEKEVISVQFEPR